MFKIYWPCTVAQIDNSTFCVSPYNIEGCDGKGSSPTAAAKEVKTALQVRLRESDNFLLPPQHKLSVEEIEAGKVLRVEVPVLDET